MLNATDPHNSKKTSHKSQVRCGIGAAGLRHQYTLLPDDAERLYADCIVIFVSRQQEMCDAAKSIDPAFAGEVSTLFESGMFRGKLGSSWYQPTPLSAATDGVLLVGVGDYAGISTSSYYTIVDATYVALIRTGAKNVAMFLGDLAIRERDDSWKLQHLIMRFEAAVYRYREQDADTDISASNLHCVALSVGEKDKRAISVGKVFAEAISIARALADTPPNICTPTYLADYAESVADRFVFVSASILDECDMHELGMNAMLSVGQGSLQPSKFIQLSYSHPDAQDESPIILVGKGVTFDTGGTALKSRQAMGLMKYDMCGAAAVLATLQAAATLELPINLVGLCACAENMPGGAATRPSDVVTSMSGKSIEIVNPDAEGRLLLCDALTYAERFEPAAVIDVATLTGASLVALGRHYSALFSNNERLLESIMNAGSVSMDKAWQLPLSAEDDSQLNSDFADLANMGDGTAGCVVAALFLARFTTTYPWAHLDVSGTAKAGRERIAATGRPVALLLQYLIDRDSVAV